MDRPGRGRARQRRTGGGEVGASSVASVWLVTAGMSACGYGVAVWDVAMNVEGAAVERLLGRSSCPDCTPASAWAW